MDTQNNNSLKAGSNLEKLLKKGEFVVTAELGPPRGASREAVEEKAKLLKGFADAYNLTDCQTAMVRLSSIASGVMLLNMGMEPIIQMTCRDRNRIAMQSDILGAAALGMKNILCLTGDHQRFGDHPEAKGVFDIDSVQQLNMFRQMRDESKFQSGDEIKVAPKLFLGSAANPFADPFKYRAPRLSKKVKAGSDFIQTQIIYNVKKFEEWMGHVRDMGLHKEVSILAGLTPIKSLGMARYMKNNVPGLDVPDGILERLKAVKDKKAEGINICLETIEQVKNIEGVAGVHLMAIEWEETIPEIVERAGLLPRPTC
ncbi:MAG: methylenetetrahydrofolate reductase [Planctomycetes bacterium]|nr:methylenetetrahydrofolate reductase [Planctomycetota bacterium]